MLIIFSIFFFSENNITIHCLKKLIGFNMMHILLGYHIQVSNYIEAINIVLKICTITYANIIMKTIRFC